MHDFRNEIANGTWMWLTSLWRGLSRLIHHGYTQAEQSNNEYQRLLLAAAALMVCASCDFRYGCCSTSPWNGSVSLLPLQAVGANYSSLQNRVCHIISRNVCNELCVEFFFATTAAVVAWLLGSVGNAPKCMTAVPQVVECLDGRFETRNRDLCRYRSHAVLFWCRR